MFHHSLLCSVSLQLDDEPIKSYLAGLAFIVYEIWSGLKKKVFGTYDVINNTATIVVEAGLFTLQITNNPSV